MAALWGYETPYQNFSMIKFYSPSPERNWLFHVIYINQVPDNAFVSIESMVTCSVTEVNHSLAKPIMKLNLGWSFVK